jgi:hypothetical protein
MSNIAIVYHGYREGCESHKQDGETLSAQHRCNACQRLAILPWPSDLPLDMNGQWPVPRIGSIAAGQKAGA